MKRNGVLQAIVDFVEGAIVGVGAILPVSLRLPQEVL